MARKSSSAVQEAPTCHAAVAQKNKIGVACKKAPSGVVLPNPTDFSLREPFAPVSAFCFSNTSTLVARLVVIFYLVSTL